jgi:hypothetical protein
MLSTFWVRSAGPMLKFRFSWMGTLMRLATGFARPCAIGPHSLLRKWVLPLRPASAPPRFCRPFEPLCRQLVYPERTQGAEPTGEERSEQPIMRFDSSCTPQAPWPLVLFSIVGRQIVGTTGLVSSGACPRTAFTAATTLPLIFLSALSALLAGLSIAIQALQLTRLRRGGSLPAILR